MSLKHKNIVGIWSNYNSGADGNPHLYLLNKKWNSYNLVAEYLDNGMPIEKNSFHFSKKNIKDNLYQTSLFKKIYNKLTRQFFWRKFNKWCEKFIIKNEISIIHAHFGYTAVRILPIIKKLKLPLVVTFYGVDGSQMLLEQKWVNDYQKMFKYTSKVIVLCEEVKNRLIKIGCPENKIIIWQIPIKLSTYQYHPRIIKETTNFIIGARFVEKKGHIYLLQAFKKLVLENHKVKMCIVGYGNEKNQIEQEIKKNNLTQYVTLIDTALKPGFPILFNNLLQENDVFVLPSIDSKNGDDEGGPSLTLVAAQAAGLPVICTKFPGAEITVFENKNGLYCLPRDVDSLYEKMVYLIDNKEKWNTLGKAGSDFVHDLFRDEKQMPIIENTLQSLL